MSGLRIVHAVRSHRFAGVEQHIRRLALAQAEAGDTVHVVGGDPVRMADELARGGVAFTPATTTVAVMRALHRLAAHTDVVNAHMTAADGATVLACRGAGRPALVSTRHFAQPRARIRLLGQWIDAKMDAEIAVSTFVARAIRVPSTVVYPGLPAVTAVSDHNRELIVLMAQRLQPEKHSTLGVRAFALSGLAERGWILEVAGDGPDLEEMTRLTAEHGVSESVRFVGFRDDVPALMSRASLLLATCPVEGLGLTVLEAMAGGLPVVAPAVGGPAELLEGLDSRALFAADVAREAAAHLRALADDDKGRAAYGSAVRSRQRSRFTVSRQVADTRRVYERAIEARRV